MRIRKKSLQGRPLRVIHVALAGKLSMPVDRVLFLIVVPNPDEIQMIESKEVETGATAAGDREPDDSTHYPPQDIYATVDVGLRAEPRAPKTCFELDLGGVMILAGGEELTAVDESGVTMLSALHLTRSTTLGNGGWEEEEETTSGDEGPLVL